MVVNLLALPIMAVVVGVNHLSVFQMMSILQKLKFGEQIVTGMKATLAEFHLPLPMAIFTITVAVQKIFMSGSLL